MHKKILPLLLSVCLMLSLIPVASAAENGKCGEDAYWSFDGQTGTLSITGSGSTDDYRVVEDGVDVIYDKPWEHLQNQIRHLVIGEGITRLGSQAFYGLENLETLALSDTVTEIGNFCFGFASKLTELDLPSGLCAIGQQAFMCCYGLTEVYLPDTLTFLDGCAFHECLGLRRVTFGSDPTLPGIIIASAPFRNCSALEEILVEEGHFALKSIDGVLYMYDDYGLSLLQYPLGRKDSTFTIADGTRRIEQFAVESPTWLERVTVPASVEFVGVMALCEGSLQEVCFQGDAPELESEALGNFPMTVYYPAGNGTWTKEIMDSQHSELTWIPCNPANPFRDVPVGSFYEESVIWAVENGITSGATETTFNPDGDCLRAQVVTFLWRAEGEPKPVSESNPFVDVKETDFYYDAVLWAVENGITNGADATHFNPMGVCNRAQVVTFLHRAFEEPAVEGEENPFTDVAEGAWYTEPVLWAVENGVTNGLSATEFGPNADCNRAQIVTFLYRAYNE